MKRPTRGPRVLGVSRRGRWEVVDHQPRWEPAQLPVGRHGITMPGFECVHQLENGNGRCGGNVFRIEDAVGTHCCIADRDQVATHRIHAEYARRRRARSRRRS